MRMRVLFSALWMGCALAASTVSLPAMAQDFQFGPPDSKAKTPKPKPPAAKPATAPPAAATAPALPAQQSASPSPVAPVQSNKYSATNQLPPKPAPANCKTTGTFEGWLAAFRKEVAAEGMSPAAISEVLDGMVFDPEIIKKDRRQGVFMLSFLEFSDKLATKNRMVNGRAKIAQNKAVFDRVQNQFGTPAAVITAFWALESDFGSGMGKSSILRSIATLAYDCRRGPMFREELKAVIRIVERGDMRPSEMIGSWAGEIGQTQFLPTRFLEHAIDYDGDGKINLFSSDADIIGTTANYMNHLGWRPNEPWIVEVDVPDNLPWQESGLTIKHPRAQWAKWGVTRTGGQALETDNLPASLLLPMGRFGPAFLAFNNFDMYVKWNQSLTYTLTAAYLATRIDGAAPMQRGKAAIPMLSAEEAKELQRQLVKRGFDVGEIDGKLGSATRTAVKAMQIKFGMPADSYPTAELLAALRGN